MTPKSSSCNATKVYDEDPLRQSHNINKWSKRMLQYTYLNLDSSSWSIHKSQSVFLAFQILVFVLKLSPFWLSWSWIPIFIVALHVGSLCKALFHIQEPIWACSLLDSIKSQIWDVVSSFQVLLLLCNWGCLIEV